MMTWEILISMIATLGGFETIKYFLNRKTNRRLAIAEAESAEFHRLQETTIFLQEQLQKKEERFAEQTDRLRKIQTDLYEEREKRFSVELEMSVKRCNSIECPFREPPTAHTKPMPGLTKEQYFANRQLPSPRQSETGHEDAE